MDVSDGFIKSEYYMHTIYCDGKQITQGIDIESIEFEWQAPNQIENMDPNSEIQFTVA